MAPSAVYAAASAKGKGKGKRTADDVQAEDEAEEIVREEETAESSENEDDDDDDEDIEEVTTSKRARTSATSSAINLPAKTASSSASYKQKTLILSSRGITHRMRHMMKDLAALLPHSKTGTFHVLLDVLEKKLTLWVKFRRRKARYETSAWTP